MKLSLDSWKCCRCSCQHRPARFWQGPGYFIATPLQVPGKGCGHRQKNRILSGTEKGPYEASGWNWTEQTVPFDGQWFGEMVNLWMMVNESRHPKIVLKEPEIGTSWYRVIRNLSHLGFRMFYTSKMFGRISSSVYEQKFNFHWTATSKGINTDLATRFCQLRLRSEFENTVWLLRNMKLILFWSTVIFKVNAVNTFLFLIDCLFVLVSAWWKTILSD